MKREYIPDGRFFRVSNFIFNYPLTPIERTVYFYLLCLAALPLPSIRRKRLIRLWI